MKTLVKVAIAAAEGENEFLMSVTITEFEFLKKISREAAKKSDNDGFAPSFDVILSDGEL